MLTQLTYSLNAEQPVQQHVEHKMERLRNRLPDTYDVSTPETN